MSKTGWIRLSEVALYYKYVKDKDLQGSELTFREYLDRHMTNLCKALWPDGYWLIGKNNKTIKVYRYDKENLD